MSEIPQPSNESLRNDIDTFVQESNWVSEAMASAIEDGSMDLDNYKGRVDLVLRNPGVLYDRMLTSTGEIGGMPSEDRAIRLGNLNDRAREILVRDGKTPDESEKNHLLTLPTVMSRGVSPLAAQALPEIIREGNALVAEIVNEGNVNSNLTRYFASNITAISSSLPRTTQHSELQYTKKGPSLVLFQVFKK